MNLKRTLSLLLCLAFALGMFATCGAAAGGSEVEPEATEAPAAAGALMIVTDDGLAENSDSSAIRGGTNMEDAILLPLNTKLYGTTNVGGQWYAFTTTSDPSAVYSMTTVNKTRGTHEVGVFVYDGSGEKLTRQLNSDWGGPYTTVLEELAPDTVYYLKIESGSHNGTTGDWYPNDEEIDFRLEIRAESALTEGYSTSDNLSEARGLSAMTDNSIVPATNVDEISYLPLNAKLGGTTPGYSVWFAVVTSGEKGAYEFDLLNKTLDSHEVQVRVYSETGGYLGYVRAGSDGIISAWSCEDMEPDAVYYLQIDSGSHNGTTNDWYSNDEEIDYTLTINAPEAPATPEPATVEPLIFETPFELNETKIMFVGDEATFIDEAAAREACAPVAEVILAHPEHQVLLVGTTASNGSDEYCLDLSSRRAAAVKDLLVSAYGVPEDQLLSVGLGYKNDPFARANDLDANGNLIESEAGKNRRVIVLDAEDPIAQEILASNG